jgi:hypothetical protein
LFAAEVEIGGKASILTIMRQQLQLAGQKKTIQIKRKH